MEKSLINKELHELIKKLKQHRSAYIFLDPIQNILTLYPTYQEVIKHPIDLTIIESKVLDKQYSSSSEFKDDIYLMLDNCRIFNKNLVNYVKIADTIQLFFDNNFKKTEVKILKSIEKLEQQQQNNKQNKIQNINNNYNILYSKNNFPYNSSNNRLVPLILGSNEEERIYERLFNLFSKITLDLNVEENIVEEQVMNITKSLIKRNKSFDLICEETVKFLNENLKNKDDRENKLKFLKKFRKLIKSIKDDQGEETAKMNIKINLNKDIGVDIKNSKEMIENALLITQEFLDNQKIPEVYRDIEEYAIE